MDNRGNSKINEFLKKDNIDIDSLKKKYFQDSKLTDD
jgi:hypothetical protein